MLITITLIVLLALAAAHWFARQGGASGPSMKPVDLVLLAGLGLACWVGYLVLNIVLPVLIALAFAVAVELYIRKRRKRWLQDDTQPSRERQTQQPEIAQARRVIEPARLIPQDRPTRQVLTSDKRPALTRPIPKR